jgi:hypothetical protein
MQQESSVWVLLGTPYSVIGFMQLYMLLGDEVMDVLPCEPLFTKSVSDSTEDCSLLLTFDNHVRQSRTMCQV